VALPGIVVALRMVPKGGVDPTLGRSGVGANGVDLREHGDVGAGRLRGDGGSKASQSATDDQNVVTQKLRHATASRNRGSSHPLVSAHPKSLAKDDGPPSGLDLTMQPKLRGKDCTSVWKEITVTPPGSNRPSLR
jgi:hypothetical protein